MLLKIFFSFLSLFVFTNALINTQCFKWIFNDGNDCRSFLPGLNLLPLPEVLSHTVTCKEGTYTNAAGTPWECHMFNPSCLNSIKPQFQLYTPEIRNAQLIDFTNLEESVKDTKIDSTKPLYVIVHGFGSGIYPNQWMVDMKNALVTSVS